MRVIVSVFVALAALSTGCSSTRDSLTVLAAASLTDVFTRAGAEFTARTGVEVTFSFAGSQTLVQQLAQGSPGDVLATADDDAMQRAVADGTVTDPQPFATNTLTLAVAPGNPKGVRGLADLSRADLLFVRCAPVVPCGAASDTVLTGHEVTPVSEENSVTDVLGKVSSGEADVGLVYATDIRRADVTAVAFPEADRAVNTYPIAVTRQANTGPDRQDAAGRFVAFITGPDGRRLLTDAGFGA